MSSHAAYKYADVSLEPVKIRLKFGLPTRSAIHPRGSSMVSNIIV